MKPDFRRSFPAAAAIIAFIAAGALVRVWGLGDYFLSPDEATIMAIARKSTLAGVFKGTLVQAHPPFHFFLMHFWPGPGNNIMWLRMSSIIPGLLFIPAAYLLGKKAVGPAAAWTMALFAAFAHAPLTMSQVIRPYALLGLFISAAMWFWIDYFERPRPRTAAVYAACALAALLFHYSGGLFIAGAGAAGAALLLARRRPLREFSFWAAAQLPAAAATIALYHLHLARIPGLHREWINGYLISGFGAGGTGLPDRFSILLVFFFLRQTATIMPMLVALGAASLVMCRRWPTMVLTGFMIASAIAFNLAGAYPLYGLRHSYWLFPTMALLLSAPFELLRRGKPSDSFRLTWPIATGLTLSASALAGLCLHYDFPRTLPLTAVAEFPISRRTFDRTITWIEKNTRPEDLIVTTVQSADLFRFPLPEDTGRVLGPSLSVVSTAGRDFYYEPLLLNYVEVGQLEGVIREALAFNKPRPEAAVIVLNLGYENRALALALDQFCEGRIAPVRRVDFGFFLIQSMPVEAVIKALEP